MSVTARSSEGLDARRKQALFRAWHRGTREMDFVMGGFANIALADFSTEELVQFEALIDVPDRELFSWISGAEVPEPHNTPLFARMKAFHHRPASER